MFTDIEMNRKMTEKKKKMSCESKKTPIQVLDAVIGQGGI